MKVGFYIGKICNKEIGGGYTFQNSLISELLKTDFKKEVFIYYESDRNIFNNADRIKFINLNFECRKQKKILFFLKCKKKRKNIEDIFQRDGIQCVYFVLPAFVKLYKTPYILTVWDLGHKKHTYFPEVSYGNQFYIREDYYKDAVQKAAYTVIGTETGKKQLCNYYNMDEHRIKINPMPTPDYVYSEQAYNLILKKDIEEEDRSVFLYMVDTEEQAEYTKLNLNPYMHRFHAPNDFNIIIGKENTIFNPQQIYSYKDYVEGDK